MLQYLERKNPMPWGRLTTLILIQIAILTVYTGLLFAGSTFIHLDFFSRSSSPFDMKYSPMRDAYRYEVREVGYSFNGTNEFKGHSVEETDKQWSSVLNQAHMVRLSETEMGRTNLSSVQLADGSEDYIAAPVAYHMLHCLYNIYKSVHPEAYPKTDFTVKHVEHCVDNLRQFVQCHVGDGFETWKWLDYRKLPWPVLSTQEVCVDWSHFDGWVQDHSVPSEDMKTMKDGKLLRHPKFGPISMEDLKKHEP